MAQAKTLSVGGIGYEVIDDTARSNAKTALNNAEYNRQGQIGKYGGQNIATILAGEIGSGSVYDALHKRIAAANFAGLRVGDYLDVPLVSASAVTTQQSVRFLLAHIDPYLYCGDNSKGHHIAFVASAPIAVAKTVTGVANDSFLMWNTTNTNQGTADQKCPYPNSNLKAWETAFEACLPEGLTKYLLTQRVLLEERYSASGALNDSNSWSWQDIGKVFSLSEMEVYGCPVWGGRRAARATASASTASGTCSGTRRTESTEIGAVGGCVPSWVAPRPACATSTTTATLPTTTPRRTSGFAPAPASSSASQPSALYSAFRRPHCAVASCPRSGPFFSASFPRRCT